MKTKSLLTTAVAAFFLISVGLHNGFAKEGEGKTDTSGTQAEQSTDQMNGHEGIESGRDFGQHVSEHNDHFSGDHNPGNHQGYSGIK